MKLGILTTIDTIHGESDGLPYSWLVRWVETLPGGSHRIIRTIAYGKSPTLTIAQLESQLWEMAAQIAGPDMHPEAPFGANQCPKLTRQSVATSPHFLRN